MSGRDLPKWAAGFAAGVLNALFPAKPDGRLGGLVYHRVSPNIPGVPKPSMNVTPDRFRRQLTGLLERGYAFWPLRRVLESRAAGLAFPPRIVVLTFDDAFESVYLHAWPVMKELRIPGTVFMSTSFLDASEPFPFDAWGKEYQGRVPAESYRPLTTNQCHEMLQNGLVELGAHTHSHHDFRGRAADFQSDLQLSVDILRARFGLEDVPMAYPFGKPSLGFVDEHLAEAARRTGVVCGLTTEDALVDPAGDPFRWGRFNAYDYDSVGTLCGKLDGWYSRTLCIPRWFVGGRSQSWRAQPGRDPGRNRDLVEVALTRTGGGSGGEG